MGSGVATPQLMPSEQLALGERHSRVRVIDALVGGKHNYHADREVAGWIASVLPGGFDGAKRLFVEDFRFRARVCRMLISRAKVKQFVLCGVDQWATSITPLHQLIQWADPDAVVVYVEPELDSERHTLNDFDTATNERGPVVRVVHDDIYDPALLPRLFASGTVGLDDTEPVVLLHCATLPFLPADSRLTAAEITAGQIETLPEGSFFAASHLCIPDDAADNAATVKAARILKERSFGARHFLLQPEIAALFADLHMIIPSPLTRQSKPVPCPQWYPAGPSADRFAVDDFNLGAVAHKGKPWPFA